MGNKDNAVIQHIITYIKNIFVKTKGVSGSKLDEELISSAKSEEEKALIKEMCEDTERYYYNPQNEMFSHFGTKR